MKIEIRKLRVLIKEVLEASPMAKFKVNEQLAAYSHDQSWSGWMKYLVSKCAANEDGSLTIPASLVTRWTRQMNTAYIDLPESEKESDRAEAIKIMKIFLGDDDDDIKRI